VREKRPVVIVVVVVVESSTRITMALYNLHDDEDEFFGNDDEGADINRLDLGDRESRAKEEELKKIAYVEAYDVHKETRLQEGFEAGYKDTFKAAMRIGDLLGSTMAQTKFSTDANHTSVDFMDASTAIARRIRHFLTSEETTTESDEARQELEQLFRELQESLQN
jgi:hypothetical protein